MGSRTRLPDMIATWRTRSEAEAARAAAQRVVERWNAALATGHGAKWSPTIRAAVAAGMPWMDVYCPQLPHKPCDRHSHDRSSPDRLDRYQIACK